MIKKNIILLNVTISIVFIFSFILVRSYRVAEVKKKPDILPLIKNKTNVIKIKTEQIVLDAKETSTFYNDIEGSEENISDIKTSKTIEIKENYDEELESKSRLNNIIAENTDIDKNNVELDKNIKNITINSGENESLKQTVTSNGEEAGNRYDNFYKVQLIALKDRQQAELYADSIKKIYKDILTNLNVYLLSVNLEEKGVLYRVRIGYFKDKKTAEKFCEDFFKKDINFSKTCIVVK